MGQEIEAFAINRHFVFKCYMKNCEEITFNALSDGSLQCANPDCNTIYKYSPVLRDWQPCTDDDTIPTRKKKSKKIKRNFDMERDKDIIDDDDDEGNGGNGNEDGNNNKSGTF